MIAAILVLLLFFQTAAPVVLPHPRQASVSAAKTRGFDNYIYTDGYTGLDKEMLNK